MTRTSRAALAAIALAVLAATPAHEAIAKPSEMREANAKQKRPNVVVVMTDDQNDSLLGMTNVINRLSGAGTTFRKLPDADKEGLTERKAVAFMLAQPAMIKRPVLEIGKRYVVGFKPEIYRKEVLPGS